MAWYSRENRRRNAIALGVGSVILLALVLYGQVLWGDYHYERLEKQASLDRQAARDRYIAEHKEPRVVHVTERYDLSWPARDAVPELKMSIPVVELGAWRAARNPEIKETIRGPYKLELVVPLPREKRLGEIEMFRDEVKPGPGEPLEQIRPCATSFLHRGRYVKVYLAAPSGCAYNFSREAKAYAVEEADRFLERLTFETLTPPSLDMQVQRVRKAQDDCKASLDLMLCNYAVALGHTVLKQAPGEVAEAMLAAMMTQPDRSERWDYFYLEDILAALKSLGQSESPQAIAAHALRAKLRNDENKPEIKQAQAESLDALFALAPRLAAEDPLQQVVADALRRYLDGEDATRLKIYEVARLWHEKAAAQDPASDLALKTRFNLCNVGRSAPVPEFRKQLGRCADDFLAVWRKRVASGQGTQALGFDEATLAYALPQLHYSYAFASKDFRGGADGIRRVDEFARTRFPPADYSYLHNEIRKYEEMLGAKAP